MGSLDKQTKSKLKTDRKAVIAEIEQICDNRDDVVDRLADIKASYLQNKSELEQTLSSLKELLEEKAAVGSKIDLLLEEDDDYDSQLHKYDWDRVVKEWSELVE